MNKSFFLLMMIFGSIFAKSASAQSISPDGLDSSVPKLAADVVDIIKECSSSQSGEGVCNVTVLYSCELFPLYFIQGRDTLERIMSAESALGFETIQNVKYELLPNGATTFILEVRNASGGTFVWPRVGKLSQQ